MRNYGNNLHQLISKTGKREFQTTDLSHMMLETPTIWGNGLTIQLNWAWQTARSKVGLELYPENYKTSDSKSRANFSCCYL